MNVETSLKNQDVDPLETDEWLDSMRAVIEREGLERAHYLSADDSRSTSTPITSRMRSVSPHGTICRASRRTATA